MERDYLDFEVSITDAPTGQVVRVTGSPAGTGEAPFALPFKPVELAQFMTAVGPPRVASRRVVPVETRVMGVKDYGQRLGAALLAGEVGQLFRASLSTAKQQGAGLRVRLGLESAPDLEPIPWEYLYDRRCQMVCVSGGADVEGVHCEHDRFEEHERRLAERAGR